MKLLKSRGWGVCTVLGLGLSAGVTACNAELDDSDQFTVRNQRQVANGGFDADTGAWWGANTTPYWENGKLCADVPGGTVNPWDVIVGQGDMVLEAGSNTFSFSAQALGVAAESVVARSLVQLPVDPYTPFAEIPALLGSDLKPFSQSFSGHPAGEPLVVQFQLGGYADPWTFCVDDVEVGKQQVQLARNGTFDSGAEEWWTTDELIGDTTTGEFCTTVPAGGDPWSHILGQSGIELIEGNNYAFSFLARGDGAANVRGLVQLSDAPYTGYIEFNEQPGADGVEYSGSFVATESTTNAAIQFQVGGASEPWLFCVDNVSLLSDAPREYYTPDTGPRVRINQLGYPKYGPKRGTLVSDATEPVEFRVLTSTGKALFTGLTTPAGIDPSAGVAVHTFDFTALTKTKTDLVVVAEGQASYPFSIASDPYQTLRVDALDFYYTQRSGIAIDGTIAGEAYARPAGHVSEAGGDDLNQGDVAVPCQPADVSALIYGDPWTCEYTLDVTGGWYDAGDHGKYVVNGGISVYQLLSLYERSTWAKSADKGALQDGTLAIPENDNGIPDVLDEVRWELEFFLKMVVPSGDPLSGMVHHKVHDHQWTGLPLLPDQDDKLRFLHRPSTAATLNLAATAAHASRLYEKYDKKFAKKLLKAAERAWTAALAHPDLYAPLADGSSGGGAYDDTNVDDEFYWAAVELYLSTEKKEYKKFILSSPVHTAEVFTAAGFNWQQVGALGRLDLSTVKNSLPGRDQVIASVLEAAELYIAHQAANPFGQPYLPDDGHYVWGSSSQVVNNIIVLATAYDLSRDGKYQAAALQGLDYILGRNALNHSYVTDYGTVFAHNQHSRWYAHQLNPALPPPPSGSLSGGPNSTQETWDPTIARLYSEQGCAPQFCYVDDITSWSTNELTINWNSALAWIAAWAADQDDAEDCSH